MTGFDSKRAAAAGKNDWSCSHGWLRGEQCEICNASKPAQEPVECLDCGSHNVGTPATYDSLVKSVKAQVGMLHIDRLDKWLDASLKERKQREWVGLTDEEIHDTDGYKETREMYRFAHAIEAKLKEKNNG